MAAPPTRARNPIAGLLLRWLGGLRFPQLFLIFVVLFAVNLFVPDVIPFVDEILLGIATLLLGSLRRRPEEQVIDVTPPKR